jgi:soluble lytic murein transglycosylase
VGRDLRGAWLESLGRRELWRPFLDNYRESVADGELRCQRLRARIALLPTNEPIQDAVRAWLTPRRLPSECEPVFEWLRARGALTDDLIERRVRLLLEAGQPAFARVIARRLPTRRAEPLLEWASFIDHPRRAIDALIQAPDKQVAPAILLDVWTRFARTDPTAALERYKPLVKARKLAGAQRARYALELALGLAWDRQADKALEFFGRAAVSDIDDYALAWQARSALWAGDWKNVEASIQAMSARQREEARWRYWAARAAAQRKDAERAEKLYASILPDDNYYSAMAAARLRRPALPHLETLPVDSALLGKVASRPAFVRAHELLRAGLRVRAIAEWQYGLESLDEAERLQGIQLAALWRWYDVAVATATRERVFNDYDVLYPRPYRELVTAGARRNGLEPPLLYGLIRQESLFRLDAGSSGGALGLTQLMPETARRIARGLGWTIRRADLFDPEVSITLGGAHLRDLIDRFGGQRVVALAAYNAGANAAERWLPNQPMDADIWIENIPYNETREYVQRVLWHSIVFAWLGSGKGQNAGIWIGPVIPTGYRALLDRETGKAARPPALEWTAAFASSRRLVPD